MQINDLDMRLVTEAFGEGSFKILLGLAAIIETNTGARRNDGIVNVGASALARRNVIEALVFAAGLSTNVPTDNTPFDKVLQLPALWKKFIEKHLVAGEKITFQESGEEWIVEKFCEALSLVDPKSETYINPKVKD